MRSRTFVMLFAFVKQTGSINLTMSRQASMDKLVDNLAAKVTDKFIDRVGDFWPLHPTDLEKASLSKAATEQAQGLQKSLAKRLEWQKAAYGVLMTQQQALWDNLQHEQETLLTEQSAPMTTSTNDQYITAIITGKKPDSNLKSLEILHNFEKRIEHDLKTRRIEGSTLSPKYIADPKYAGGKTLPSFAGQKTLTNTNSQPHTINTFSAYTAHEDDEDAHEDDEDADEDHEDDEDHGDDQYEGES